MQQQRRIRARYLVGCDGGSSTVRKQIGAKLEGTPVIQRVQSTFIRAPRLAELMSRPPAWCCYAVNPRRCGTVFAIDGHGSWLVHNHLNADEPEFDSVDRDHALRVLYALGKDARMPRAYGALVQEQRRLGQAQMDARRNWRS